MDTPSGLRRRRLLLAAALASFVPGPALAVSESFAPWLGFTMGARASGMGGAQVTEASGADRLYWNPALLGFQEGLSATSMYFVPVPDLTDDVRFWYVAAAGGSRSTGGFGANFMHLSYGEIYPGAGVTAWDRSAGLGYGIALSDDVGAGLAAKLIQLHFGPDVTVDAWAVDFGIHVKELFRPARSRPLLPNGLRWGLVIQNFGPHVDFGFGGTPSPLPLTFRTGVGVDAWGDEIHRLTLAADMSKVLVRQHGGTGVDDFEVDPAWKALVTAWTDGSLREELEEASYHLGAEYALRETVFLRTGWVHDTTGDITDYTLGIGLRYWGLQFDYAQYPQSTGLDRVHRFSLTADMPFGGTR